ncbi:hypothetical protein PPL_12354 [Heterostelium album PN500]|uniref:Uncharacterized protein n=1 Tax=Heterostelium pallidum (strain ATCC 26659 / Pp 5 / PN500) TaxID=670386 RepID=D3BLH7_HETP5|nr:hypothetical protein PPL_12354 [Heterostelium album PN500]EFA77742.1 hypothetical protein PPL_12354 [Heterostelium album PN500]|eukprot:XP_020429870.1 hypothetical protein PPL_12354 [Heterostelium album PN500]
MGCKMMMFTISSLRSTIMMFGDAILKDLVGWAGLINICWVNQTMKFAFALIALIFVSSALAQSPNFYGTFDWKNVFEGSENNITGSINSSIITGVDQYTLTYNIVLNGLNATNNETVANVTALGPAPAGTNPDHQLFTLPLNISTATVTETSFSIDSSVIVTKVDNQDLWTTINASLDSMLKPNLPSTLYVEVYNANNSAITRAQLAYQAPTPTTTGNATGDSTSTTGTSTTGTSTTGTSTTGPSTTGNSTTGTPTTTGTTGTPSTTAGNTTTSSTTGEDSSSASTLTVGLVALLTLAVFAF